MGRQTHFLQWPTNKNKNGANLRHVPDGNAIDIHSDLIGIARKLSKIVKVVIPK